MTKRILIVEDEPDIVLSLQEDLRRQGYETGVATDGEKALQSGREGNWDLILLDVMLPKMDGFDVCRELPPRWCLDAHHHAHRAFAGSREGAWPRFRRRRLRYETFQLAGAARRVRAHLRRSGAKDEQVHRFGDCEVNFDRAELRRAGKRVELTAHEFRLLEVFLRSRGRLLTRNQLIEAAWGSGIAVTDRAVDTHVFNLRQKIEPVPAQPEFLLGVRGLGYRFESEN